jgi:carbon-monoxide dehydrogenase medium subunit
VAVAGALSYPIRLSQVEAAMGGKAPTSENIAAAAKLAAENVTTALATREDLTILSDLYASAEYRTHLIGVLTKRALMLAAKRSSFVANIGHGDSTLW